MQSAEEFARRLRDREIDYVWDGEDENRVDFGFAMSDEDAVEEVAARDAEWQARVEELEAALNGLVCCVNDDKCGRPMSKRTMSTSRAMDIARAALGRET